jgi:hypothetical protein
MKSEITAGICAQITETIPEDNDSLRSGPDKWNNNPKDAIREESKTSTAIELKLMVNDLFPILEHDGISENIRLDSNKLVRMSVPEVSYFDRESFSRGRPTILIMMIQWRKREMYRCRIYLVRCDASWNGKTS